MAASPITVPGGRRVLERTGRRDTRPLLRRGDPRQILERLMRQRYPVYAEADVVVDSSPESVDSTVHRVIDALADAGHLACRTARP